MQNDEYIGYCFRCKTKRQMNNGTVVKMKTGMSAVKGACIICGTKMFRILPKEKK